MSEPENHNWRPANYKELIKKHRKVVPPEPIKSANARISEFSSRQSAETGLAPYSGEWGTSQRTHLLKRCLFGVTKTDLEAFDNLSLIESVELLLTPEDTPTPPVNDYSARPGVGEDPDVPIGESWVEKRRSDDFEVQRVLSLKGWLLKNMSEHGHSIHQKMLLCWHNLLPTQVWEVFNPRASYQYFQMLHRNSLGNYKSMISELTKDPAMLFYLNGTFNHKDGPDENYARELQELFTLGKGHESKYTESDVAEAARVLTGWQIDWEDLDRNGPIKSRFEIDAHVVESKHFSEFYQNQIISGSNTTDGGAGETQDLVDMIFSQPETAKYICRRIYRFFVNTNIDSNTEKLVIEPMADILRAHHYDLIPAVRALFISEHFFDSSNVGTMIKPPVDLLLGSFKTFNLQAPGNDLGLSLSFYINALWTMSGWGMEVGDPPSVSGWPAYYQKPLFDKSWITTDTILKRTETLDVTTFWGFWVTDEVHPQFQFLPFVSQFDEVEDADKMLKGVLDLLLATEISQEKYEQIRLTLLAGQANPVYWADAWRSYQLNPNDENRNILVNRLRPTFQRIFQLPEFQLM